MIFVMTSLLADIPAKSDKGVSLILSFFSSNVSSSHNTAPYYFGRQRQGS